ncbi:DNA mismatch repair protein MutS [Sporosarcina pasteurii]|uniref:DNA mismatch repair protein MutS n=1 Tax=Sporosarcina pasteurii TaxID=1474 RepID=A0A380BI22_SPOPA|nr:DNA mismatch repair protein MutS [Sporosarcina pasteurii]MDS9470657.1 DNA mismatch repair protein MutS [Sporosarcina pasteurii]QBQ05657.1 DNA mismatch repair protein MutS [Sporosarcina pasteurii]SUJ01411.1 DNA mismatch repair protein mutS [Sporosarcina pasteurii]
MTTAYTPMIQQYLNIKENHKDSFLFFRLGDFYELFFDDAIQASQILEITLTSRDAREGDRIPMCGVPYHSAAGYIETLVQKGYKVAICEQTEDPRATKGIVRREVMRIVTPGTITEGKSIDTNTNHFIGAANIVDDTYYGLAYLDLSTGEGKVQYVEGDERTLISEIEALGMKEIVVDESLHIALSDSMANRNIALSIEHNEETVELSENIPGNVVEACSRLISYVKRTQKTSLDHIRPFEFIRKNAKLSIDANSMRNLELVQSIRTGTKEGTLYWLLDETVTAMGARKLKMWIHQPLADRKEIEKRLDIVTELLEEFFLSDDLKTSLKEVYDLERLAGRISMGSVNGRDLAQLRNSLRRVPEIKNALEHSGKPLLEEFATRINLCEDATALLEKSIAENPPITVKEGGVIKDGYDKKLDEYRDASRNGKQWLAELEQVEREKTGIKNLKIGYNRVFGYFIEITKSNIHLVDLERYERKQTLANAERYITSELKEKEDLILNAEADGLELEYDLFSHVREQLKPYIPEVQQLASVLSELDVLLSFAEVAEKRNYVKPVFHDSKALEIKNGRHPVVEKMMDHSLYVPNSCVLAEDANMLLITGPNMSGKSTYMRQVALTVVMAQIGCYVPCDSATLPVTDQIFTRIGAADDLASGQSTFMMEMMESQHAIVNATENSLLLFDEIGRGTSTYDGMSLAQAMMEYIHNEIGANTLFSTHYHELTTLDEQLSRLENVHVAAMEQDGKVVFLHKVMKGAADKSYGIYVADLAGLPASLLDRAKELLETFESADATVIQTVEPEQLAFFEEVSEEKQTITNEEKAILEDLNTKDVINMTPLQAMQYIVELQEKLRTEKR